MCPVDIPSKVHNINKNNKNNNNQSSAPFVPNSTEIAEIFYSSTSTVQVNTQLDRSVGLTLSIAGIVNLTDDDYWFITLSVHFCGAKLATSSDDRYAVMKEVQSLGQRSGRK